MLHTDSAELLFESTTLDHLVLVLDDHLDALNWGCNRLGGDGCRTREHEVLDERKAYLVALLGFALCKSRHDDLTMIRIDS